MFSLLSPLALWLTPLLAVPLAIALMGRSQPKTRDFPSLLPVQATLQRAMRRHRLKNWLQVILRTLALLCLLLAAAGPVWRGRSALPSPAVAALLTHNGAYSHIPLREDRSPDDIAQSTLGARQAALRRGLDSMVAREAGRLVTETVLPEDSENGGGGDAAGPAGEGRPGFTGAARYGSTAQAGEALTRLFQRLAAAAPGAAAHAWVPVFAARDLPVIAAAARPWLESNPNARLILVDHGDAASRLKAFGRPVVRAGTEDELKAGGDDAFDRAATLSVAAPLNPEARGAPVWKSTAPAAEGVRDARADEGRARIALPLPDALTEAHWIAGTFSLAEDDPARRALAFPELPVALRVPPPATLCHLGPQESYVSLASLGEGGARLKIVSLASATAQPSGGAREGCKLLYLADSEGADAALAARATAIARAGGTVILETGPRTDAVLWNRALLAPSEAGLLTVPLTTAPRAAVGQRAALATLGPKGARADRWGSPGTVTTAFGFRPAASTRVLLATSDSLRTPLLVERRVGPGRLLVWTTSLSTPAWSTIGLGPWAALAHQAVLEAGWSAGIEEHLVETDSSAWWPARNPGLDEAPRVLDQYGTPFARVRPEANGWTIGPFDNPGLYRIDGGPRTGWLAVSVADAPPAPTSADWERFEEALGAQAWARTVRHKVALDANDDWRTLYDGVGLRLGLLALAALLLFAEGVVSLRLAHGSRRESGS